jgi:hypothetical protein
MSHLILNPSNALVIRPGGVNSELPTNSFRSQRQKRRNRITSLTRTAVTVLALALIILGLALSRPCLATPGTWALLNNMSQGRQRHTATLLPSGQVLLAGGDYWNNSMGEYSTLSSVELYQPDAPYWSAWINMSNARMRYARSEHTATLLPNGKVLVVGGLYAYLPYAQGETNLNQAEIFDPETYTWRDTGSMAFYRAHHTSTLLPNGKVLVTGGRYDELQNLASAEIYDPALETWSGINAMSTPRAGHTATLLPNGKVLVTGGEKSKGWPLNSAELYDPASGQWSSAGTMTWDHCYHTATLLRIGKVLAGQEASWEIYNPFSRSWTLFYSWVSKSDHTATLLPNGQVLVAGGRADLYNSAIGTFSPTGSMNIGRVRHTATLLRNGKVLVAGGTDGSEYQVFASGEIYDPVPPPKVQLPPLLGFYPFDTGTAADFSGNRRHGTITGSPQLVAGYEGQAYYFNGGADYVTVPLNINPAQYPRLTMGAWVQTISSSPLQPLLTHDNGGFDRSIAIDYRGGGTGWSAFCGPSGQVLGAVPAIYKKWTFVAVVYDQAQQTVRLQVDDMVLTKEAASLSQGQNQLHIGASPLFSNFFDGIIDNVFVFGDALTDQQLAYIRSGGAQVILTATKRPNPGLLLLLMD